MLLASKAEVLWRGPEAAGVADAMIEAGLLALNRLSYNAGKPNISLSSEACRKLLSSTPCNVAPVNQGRVVGLDL